MEHFEIIDKNIVMIESMVKVLISSTHDTPITTAYGTLWAVEEKLKEIRAATEQIRRPRGLID